MVSGGLLVGSRLCEYAGRVTESIGIDRVFGTAVLGSYTFANQISKFAGEAVGNVTWGTLYVQALTSDRGKIVELHRQLCRLLAAILFPASLLAAAAAPELIELLLGPKWLDITFMLRVLLPASALTMIATQVGAVLLANGRFVIQFWCAGGQSLGRVLVVCVSPWIGLTGTVYGLGAVSLIYSAAILLAARQSTGCTLLPLLRGLIGPAVSSLVAAGVCFFLIGAYPTSTWLTLGSLLLGLGVFVATMLLIDRKGLLNDWQAIRRLAGRPGTAAATVPPGQHMPASDRRDVRTTGAPRRVHMELQQLSTYGLLMLYHSMKLGLRYDDRFYEGPRFEIRENPDWKAWSEEIAAELEDRGAQFERIPW
jgi:PST family polysaccharide transporter